MTWEKLTLVAVVLAAGCARVSVADDIDDNLNFAPLTSVSNVLHTPYIRGASMRLYVHSSDRFESYGGWTVASSEPSVFSVSALRTEELGERTSAWVDGQALSEGQATLTVRGADDVALARVDVTVALPDRIDLEAHGPLLIGRPDQAFMTGARVVVGGTATFLARAYLGDTELHGLGALTLSTPTGMTAQIVKTFLSEDRDWVQITPSVTGSATLGVMVDGEPLLDFPIEGVPASDAASIRILGMDESKAQPKDWLVALAQAYDNLGNILYGASYTWDVDGQTQPGLGDLYRYQYQPGQPRMLSAHLSGMQAMAAIHSGVGFVDSTNSIGCSAAPGRPAPKGSAGLLALWLAGVAYSTRRRRADRRWTAGLRGL